MNRLFGAASTCLHRLRPTFGQHRLSSSSSSTVGPIAASKFLLERLTARSLIRVRGEQSRDFLQALCTNDLQHLHPEASEGGAADATTAIYTMFLNKAGRVLYDAIIYKPPSTIDTYLIECDCNIVDELQKHLKVFRVRKKIDIDNLTKELAIWVAFAPAAASGQPDAARSVLVATAVAPALQLAIADPRLRHLGTRIIAAHGAHADALMPALKAPASGASSGGEEAKQGQMGADIAVVRCDADAHRSHRYALGIGEGSDELPVGKCFPLESNADYLHGVSFHKGCYLGQEFTARTHHTGVVRKRLLPVRFDAEAGQTGVDELTMRANRNVESTNGTQLGKVRGFVADRGLALLKFEPALAEEASLVFGGTGDAAVLGRAARPQWWPQEAPKKGKV